MKPQNAELDGRTGEGDLFAQLYPALRRFAAVVGPLEVEPDDLVQEAVERALRGGPLDRFDRLDAYLRKTMLNLASNHRRRLGRARRARTRLGGHQDLVTQGEYPSNVSDILALPPRARAIVYLCDIEGRSSAEVAAHLGMTPAAVRTAAVRARRRLRADLGEEEAS